MRNIYKAGVVLTVLVFALVGFTYTANALTQSDVDLICVIIDCNQSGIGEALDSLVDDESTEITRNLFRGISGDDVEELQELLAEDPTIYPEGLITGFYGELTERAVLRFQERFGIDAVGIVGPITRGTLNKLFKHKFKGQHLSDVFEDDADDDDESDDEDSDNSGKNVKICHKGKTISVGPAAVQAHVQNHDDSIGRCGDDIDDDDEDDDSDDNNEDEDDQDEAQEEIDQALEAIEEAQEAVDAADEGDVRDEAQELVEEANEYLKDAEEAFDNEEYDEAEELAEEAQSLADDALDVLEEDEPLEIGDIVVDIISSTSVTISWETSEDAVGTVWVSTESGFEIGDNGVESGHDPNSDDDHDVIFNGLDSDTTYYFLIGSETGEVGGKAWSKEESFSTPTE